MHVEVRVGQVGQRIRMAASVASRYALGADGVGAARPGARGSRVTASRYALGAEGGGAARPGAYMLSPPDNCARCLLVVGTSKTSCASRCSRRSVQGALRAPAAGGAANSPCRLRLPDLSIIRAPPAGAEQISVWGVL